MRKGKKFQLANDTQGTQDWPVWEKYPYWWSMSYKVKVTGGVLLYRAIKPKLSFTWNVYVIKAKYALLLFYLKYSL